MEYIKKDNMNYMYKATISKYKSWDQLVNEKRRKSRHWKVEA